MMNKYGLMLLLSVLVASFYQRISERLCDRGIRTAGFVHPADDLWFFGAGL